jgi:threonine dehydrogenase-like Zn-dependent dehydrogenase
VKVVELVAPCEIQVAKRPIPASGKGALIRVRSVGICGTDVKIVSGRIPVDYPRVLGHEMVGVVDSVADFGRIEKGTRVIVNPAMWCGRCHLCTRHLEHLCRNGGLLGRDDDGVFAEYVVAEEDRLHVVPEEISSTAAVLLQVLGTVVHAQRRVDVFPEQTAVVIGLGVTGLLHLQVLLARGIQQVIGISRSPEKLTLASQLGAISAIGPNKAAKTVDELTHGRGADIVIECVGTEATLARSIELAGHAAHIVVFGTITEPGDGSGLPYYQLYEKELTLHHPRAATGADYEAGIAMLMDGRLKFDQLEQLVTARYPLSDPQDAFSAVGKNGSLKVVMDVETDA